MVFFRCGYGVGEAAATARTPFDAKSAHLHSRDLPQPTGAAIPPVTHLSLPKAVPFPGGTRGRE